MKNLAYRIPVFESESGWGTKLDDFMVCTTFEDACEFKKEFNSKNNLSTTPDWYMYAQGEPELMELTKTQIEYLQRKSRVWQSTLVKL